MKEFSSKINSKSESRTNLENRGKIFQLTVFRILKTSSNPSKFLSFKWFWEINVGHNVDVLVDSRWRSGKIVDVKTKDGEESSDTDSETESEKEVLIEFYALSFEREPEWIELKPEYFAPHEKFSLPNTPGLEKWGLILKRMRKEMSLKMFSRFFLFVSHGD